MFNFFKIYKDKKAKVNYTSKEVEVLITQLDNLLNLNNEDGIVISLQGSWGIGKTFFWNNYITHAKNETKFVNISLFGIHSLEDIKKHIVLKIYDSNKISNFLKNNPLIGKIIESKWGIDISVIANNFNKDDFKNIVICFDDFERMSPNLYLSEILGFISELKEQHQCKIVLINNSNMLKIQDELNHKKHIRKNKKGDLVERYFTTQTNNQEIFNKYTEKIIDVSLKYEPHLKDNIRLLKEKNSDKEYIDWELLETLFNSIKDHNKKLNIRLMKQIIIKLNILQEVLSSNNINRKIKNGILVEIFKGIIKDEIDLTYLDIEAKMPPSLKKSFEMIVEKHSVDLEFFKKEIEAFRLNIIEEEISKKIQDTHSRYLYELEYDNSTFVKDFYGLLNISDVDVVALVELSTFERYITEFLIKLDTENEETYQTLFITKVKIYIQNNIGSLEKDMSTQQNTARILKKYPELENHYTECKNKTIYNDSTLKDNMKQIIKKVISSNQEGNNHQMTNLLSNIDTQQHKKWMIEDREYFELIFKFIGWLIAFSGEKPFGDIYEKIMIIYMELSEDKQYAHKMKFILRWFPTKAKDIYKIFIKLPHEKRDKMLQDTAKDWASRNSKKYIDTSSNGLFNSFLQYLANEKQNSHYYETIEIAMKEYFNSGSGSTFFEEKKKT